MDKIVICENYLLTNYVKLKHVLTTHLSILTTTFLHSQRGLNKAYIIFILKKSKLGANYLVWLYHYNRNVTFKTCFVVVSKWKGNQSLQSTTRCSLRSSDVLVRKRRKQEPKSPGPKAWWNLQVIFADFHLFTKLGLNMLEKAVEILFCKMSS